MSNITCTVPPSQPQNLSILSFGATWVYVSWEEPEILGLPLSSATQYIVKITRISDGDVSFSPLSMLLSVNISSLFPNTGYDFTVTAQAVVDTTMVSSNPSELVSIITNTTSKIIYI